MSFYNNIQKIKYFYYPIQKIQIYLYHKRIRFERLKKWQWWFIAQKTLSKTEKLDFWIY